MPFLPLFPLKSVVYPHENLNLHIFEPRYRELISECVETNITFGIPTYLDNKIMGYGTEMRVTQLTKVYEDNRMDIKTNGLRVFRITDFQQVIPGKLYSGGDVTYLETENFSEYVYPELLTLVEELYALLNLNIDFLSADYQPFSYRIGHKVGLSQIEEYKLLTLPDEDQRQRFLIKTLEKTVPIVREIERTKARIALNGHFKNFDPLTF